MYMLLLLYCTQWWEYGGFYIISHHMLFRTFKYYVIRGNIINSYTGRKQSVWALLFNNLHYFMTICAALKQSTPLLYINLRNPTTIYTTGLQYCLLPKLSFGQSRHIVCEWLVRFPELLSNLQTISAHLQLAIILMQYPLSILTYIHIHIHK